jgi:hypothetical protein
MPANYRVSAISAVLSIVALSVSSPATPADLLCESLRQFVSSVKAGEKRALKFNTIWGSNFKDRAEEGMGAKRCDFGGYEPAKSACKYLMEYGSIEFAGYNAKSAITCLSPKTRFAAVTTLKSISFSLTFGTESRGSHVDVVYTEDKDLGGMVMSVTAAGY